MHPRLHVSTSTGSGKTSPSGGFARMFVVLISDNTEVGSVSCETASIGLLLLKPPYLTSC